MIFFDDGRKPGSAQLKKNQKKFENTLDAFKQAC
jgi:hypothetical protein